MLILVLGRVCRGREPASGQGDKQGLVVPTGFGFLYLTSSEGTLPNNSSLCVPMSTIGLFSLTFHLQFLPFPFVLFLFYLKDSYLALIVGQTLFQEHHKN